MISAAALPPSRAACDTPAMFEETSAVPFAASLTLREISFVAADCSSTALAIVVEMSLILPMFSPIAPIAVTATPVVLGTRHQFRERPLNARQTAKATEEISTIPCVSTLHSQSSKEGNLSFETFK